MLWFCTTRSISLSTFFIVHRMELESTAADFYQYSKTPRTVQTLNLPSAVLTPSVTLPRFFAGHKESGSWRCNPLRNGFWDQKIEHTINSSQRPADGRPNPSRQTLASAMAC